MNTPQKTFNIALKTAFKQKPWLVLLLLFVAAYCVNLLIPRDLWVQDEMRYGEVVREMLSTGNWLVPHLNGAPYPDKPALYFWIICIVSSLLGQGEFAFRIVSTLATLLAGIGIFQVGNFIAGRQCGFWASVLFGSSLLTLIVGQIVRMDMLLTAITTFSWLMLLHFDRNPQQRWLFGFWTLCALSLAIKGPISLLFTLLPGVIWIAHKSGVASLSKLRPIFGLLAIMGLVAIWMFAVYQSGQGAYLSTIWHQQLVGRTINSWSHKEPIYFYLVLLPILIMPWAGPIFSGLIKAFKQDHALSRSIVIFAMVPLAGISLVSGKLFIYLEPLVPALCVAGALAIHQVDAKTKTSPWFSWPPVLYLLAISGLITYISQHYLNQTASQAIWIAMATATLAILSAISTRYNFKHWLYATSITSVIFSWLIFGGMTTLLNPLFSARALAHTVSEHAANTQPVAVINVTRGILNYYADRTFTEVDLSSAERWAALHPEALLIIKTSDLATAFPSKIIPSSCKVNHTFQIELKEYHVLAQC
ncbi:MAG: glycosyltransferase family 39 protein [Methylophilus sp.]|nr:glycosyltransferase family 39 protein [Methylophilus sp.]